MRTYLIWISSFLLGAANALSQTEVPLRFVDSETGFAIPPNRVTITGTPVNIGRQGLMNLRMQSRPAQVTAKVEGYDVISMTLERAPQHLPVEIRLHPLQPPPEFRLEALTALMDGTNGIAAGFVADDDTRGPLEGVQVSSGRVVSTTGTRGFFSLRVPRAGTPIELTFLKPGYRTLIRRSVLLYASSVKKYRVRLQKGTGTEVVDESRFHQSASPATASELTGRRSHVAKLSAVTLPANIRVGIDCSNSTTCTGVSVVTLEDYVKHVLPSEWIAAWNAESLKAGSVAARSIGVWFSAHPKADSFDVCDTDACQVFDPDTTQSTSDNAIDATKSKVLVASGTSTVVKAEFSAENNNAGCGDGKAGTKDTSPCIDDPVCTGKKMNGHGRGMCQNGTHRWGDGKNADGTDASDGKKTWDWMISHYYPKYDLMTGTPSLQVRIF